MIIYKTWRGVHFFNKEDVDEYNSKNESPEAIIEIEVFATFEEWETAHRAERRAELLRTLKPEDLEILGVIP